MKLTRSLPQQAYDAKQVRHYEPQIAKQQNISMYQLMERAGEALFTALKENFLPVHSILVVCGKGNNGGDGFVVARLALQAGYQVTLLLLADQALITGDALLAMERYHQSGGHTTTIKQQNQASILIEQFNGEVIIDALLGTGFKGELSTVFQNTINAINNQQANVLSVDIPSGLAANTGIAAKTTIKATVTVTFIAMKMGLLTGQAANFVGQLYFADLAVANVFEQLVSSDTRILTLKNIPRLKTRAPASHKGNIGLVLAIGGGQGMPGAIRMASEAALRTGAALVAVCCHQHNIPLVFNGRPELMFAPSEPEQLKLARCLTTAKAIIIGPGLGQSDWAKQLFSLSLCLTKTTTIIDADALILLAQQPSFNENRVLTPHPKEAASLLACHVNDIEANRFTAVKNIVKKYGGICVLKGSGSLISNGKEVFINTTGNAGMASGGMGDVLSGIIAALSLQLPNLFDAVKLAVFIHGQAADIVAEQHGARGMLASDLFLPLQALVNTST